MVNGEWRVERPPARRVSTQGRGGSTTIHHLPFTIYQPLLLLLVRRLRLAGRGRPVLEQGLDDGLVALGGLDVSLGAELAHVLVALLVGALLREQAAHLV